MSLLYYDFIYYVLSEKTEMNCRFKEYCLSLQKKNCKH